MSSVSAGKTAIRAKIHEPIALQAFAGYVFDNLIKNCGTISDEVEVQNKGKSPSFSEYFVSYPQGYPQMEQSNE